MKNQHPPFSIKEAIEVMTAHQNGAEIEVAARFSWNGHWEPTDLPSWDWSGYVYRVKERVYTQTEVDDIKDTCQHMLDTCNDVIETQSDEIETLKAKLDSSMQWIEHDPSKDKTPCLDPGALVVAELRDGTKYIRYPHTLIWDDTTTFQLQIIRYLVLK